MKINLLRIAYLLDTLVQVHIVKFRAIQRTVLDTSGGGARRYLKGYVVRQNPDYWTLRNLTHYRDDIELVVENSLLASILPNEVAQTYAGTSFSVKVQKVTKKYLAEKIILNNTYNIDLGNSPLE